MTFLYSCKFCNKIKFLLWESVTNIYVYFILDLIYTILTAHSGKSDFQAVKAGIKLLRQELLQSRRE